MNYYNEFDKNAAAWLRELVKRGHLPPGDVDDRDVNLVEAKDLAGYTQYHFFCGIGGWSYALQLAGWPEDVPVWTASLPCQPWSNAGKQRGTDDHRHLWPVFHALVEQCRPRLIFGEQVPSKLGRAWLAAVRADLETLGYAVGAADLCAAGAGAPHIRQRLFWMAHAGSERRQQDGRGPFGDEAADGRTGWNGRQSDGDHVVASGGADVRLAHAQRPERWALDEHREDGCNRADDRRAQAHLAVGARGEVCAVADTDAVGHDRRGPCGTGRHQPEDGCSFMANPPLRGQRIDGGTPGQGGHAAQRDADDSLLGNPNHAGLEGHRADQTASRWHRENGPVIDASVLNSWSDLIWLPCSDGKARPACAFVQPLVDGLPKGVVRGGDRSLAPDANESAEGRVMRLKGYGNAIVPPLAAIFIRSAREALWLNGISVPV